MGELGEFGIRWMGRLVTQLDRYKQSRKRVQRIKLPKEESSMNQEERNREFLPS